jgi:hypothetical protein
MRKFLICILLFVFCAKIILCENQNNSTNFDDNTWFASEMAKNVFNSMGLDKKEEITKKEFETLFYRIFTKDQADPDRKEFFTSISEKLSKGIKDKINRDEIPAFMSKDNVINAVEETVREQFGEEYVAGIRQTMQRVFEEDNNTNSTQNNTKQEDL